MARTIKYGELIDKGIIAAGDLPAAWAAFPDTALPNGESVSFYDLFYKQYRNREIAGDTIPTFLSFLEATTFETLELLPDGQFRNLIEAAIVVESDETRKKEYKAAPNGGDLQTAFGTGGEVETITRKREYESELERAEHLTMDGVPVNVWICRRFENCFLGVF
jgi:hypothetical protein